MVLNQKLNNHRILKRLAKALNRLRVCAGWSEALLVVHTTLLEISCRGSILSAFTWMGRLLPTPEVELQKYLPTITANASANDYIVPLEDFLICTY